jgi:hypothetical protein
MIFFKSKHYLLNHENNIILITSLLASIILTMVSYPGFMYSDSYVRWNLVNTLVHGNTVGGDNWHSHIPTIIMYIPYAITGNYSSFTLLQSFLFFFTTLHLVKQFRSGVSTTIIFAILFVSSPLFAIYSVYHAPDVLEIVGFNIFLIAFFQKLNKSINNYHYLLFLLISLIIIFGCRANSITLIPIFLFCFYILYKKNKQRIFIEFQVLVLVLSFIIVSILPHALKIYKYDISAIGFSWEIVSILQTMKVNDFPKYEKYKNYLDYIGNTENAVDHNTKDSIWGMESDVFSLRKEGEIPNAKRLKHDYFLLAKNEPKYFMKNKFDFIKKTMGIHYKLNNLFKKENDEAKKFYGIVDTKQRLMLYDSFIRIFKNIDFLSKPYQVFLFTLFLIVGVGVVMKRRVNLLPYWFLWLFSAFYYLGFLITTQSQEVRYFFPSLYLLIFTSLTLIIDVCLYAIKNRRIKSRQL